VNLLFPSVPVRLSVHIVIILQENRIPDPFSDLVLMACGADIATSGLTSSGQTILLAATANAQSQRIRRITSRRRNFLTA
jgi:hypothetical protein